MQVSDPVGASTRRFEHRVEVVVEPGFVAVIVESQLVQVILFGSSNAKHDVIYANSSFIAAGVRQFFFFHAVALDFAVAFLLAVFFFFKRCLTSLSIQGGGVAHLDLFGWDVVSGGSLQQVFPALPVGLDICVGYVGR